MKKERFTLVMYLFFMVLFFFLGTVNTFGIKYWNDDFKKEECTYIETKFADYQETKKSIIYKDKGITVYCTNGESYDINPACINKMLRDDISELEKYSDITILVHPDSNEIVELTANDVKLLDFNNATDVLDSKSTSCHLFGIVMYIGSLAFLFNTIMHIKSEKHKKYKKKHRDT
ncbi:MAG: hypothetical protein IJZ57_08130 [Clostridia bacterium]|nr:hypothetical protein [Clostridia bacterium]